ncbi:MAG TPA: type I-MYXAN CRISPR-associated protein Cas5/Cmx5/DevS [Planktothrix sp. UBA8407]|jgi:CRISPR-associated protein Cas5/DevS, subtype MYXAN|nr:type I-MYXAN CRISPR-associated protein Cas5/Cmx5/DevS [Planktothrix sp. UBA8407]
MIALHIEVPYASFRKSYARSFAETYSFPPPATVYGMLLSLVGEWFRARHSGVKLGFAYKKQPEIATTLRQLSRYKYGVASKQSKLGNAPDFIETLCDIDFICWVDSSEESQSPLTLENRLIESLQYPERINRKGLVYLGLSDDAVNDISLVDSVTGTWHWLTPSESGRIELPIWVDHIGSIHTRWQRYDFDKNLVANLTEESVRSRLISITLP